VDLPDLAALTAMEYPTSTTLRIYTALVEWDMEEVTVV
jgi:hypothetical protein